MDLPSSKPARQKGEGTDANPPSETDLLRRRCHSEIRQTVAAKCYISMDHVV